MQLVIIDPMYNRKIATVQNDDLISVINAQIGQAGQPLMIFYMGMQLDMSNTFQSYNITDMSCLYWTRQIIF
jgi:hypothetical protein